MNKLYTILAAGLMALANVAEAASSTKATTKRPSLSELLASTRSSATGSTIFKYGVGGALWYLASKELVKRNYLSAVYPDYIPYVIGTAGAGALCDGVVPFAGTVSGFATEVLYAGTAMDLLAHKFAEKLPDHFRNSIFGKAVYFVILYQVISLAATYGPSIIADAVDGLVTAATNLINAPVNCAACPTCPPCDPNATPVAL